jgi:hypothetical protein
MIRELTANPRTRLALCLAVVGLMFVFHVHLKTTKIFAHPTWDAADDTGQFWSEFAFHYRFAKFFAEHPMGEWGELARDTAVQHPHTVNDWNEFTVAMEIPVGVLYRWLHPDVPFHVWVVWFDCIVSSLSLLGVFLLARALWKSDWSGVLAAALYATLYPSYGRTVKNLFLREDFAIPLILLALFFTVRAMQAAVRSSSFSLSAPATPTNRRKLELGLQTLRPHQLLASVFWLAALASWHLTQFVLAVFVGAIALYFLGASFLPRRSNVGAASAPRPESVVISNLRWLVLLLALGGVLIPGLRAKQFYLSPSMCVLYALAATAWAADTRASRIFTFAGTGIAFLVLGFLANTTYGEYAHVYELFFAKLRFLGVKPDDPAQLSWEARSLWEGAFNTAPWSEFWRSLQWCLPLSLLVAVATVCERRHNLHSEDGARRVPLKMFVLFSLLLSPLSWMVLRFFTFLGFAAAILAAGVVAPAVWSSSFSLRRAEPTSDDSKLKRGLQTITIVVALAAVVWQFTTLDFKPLDRAQPTPEVYRPVIRWIEQHTTPDTVILAHMSESPVFWAHTGRPIIAHSKFETLSVRQRHRELLDAIYADEETFFAFAQKYGADYFIFDTGFVAEGLTPAERKETRIYKAGLSGLPANCAAMLFYWHANALNHFELETATERFRVFRVLH